VSIQFSSSGRYVFAVSAGRPYRIIQFDTWSWNRHIVRTLYDPFQTDGPCRISLCFWNDRVYALGSFDYALKMAELPFHDLKKSKLRLNDEASKIGGKEGAVVKSREVIVKEIKKVYRIRTVASAPYFMLQYPILDAMMPSTTEGNCIFVGRGVNYLRKDGRLGGTLQWPIVMSVNEQNMGDWEEVEEQEDPNIEHVGTVEVGDVDQDSGGGKTTGTVEGGETTEKPEDETSP